MGTKHKHRPKHGTGGLFQQAQRLLEKGDFKQALKDAKVCYRQQPGPEARQLLERAYLARGRQLHRAGLRQEARAVAESLLELGATDASVEQRTARIADCRRAVRSRRRRPGGPRRQRVPRSILPRGSSGSPTLAEDDPLCLAGGRPRRPAPRGGPGLSARHSPRGGGDPPGAGRVGSGR